MKTKLNISAERKRKAEAYKALPLARIENPLRRIRTLLQGGSVWVERHARYAADRGRGKDVRQLAHQLLNA